MKTIKQKKEEDETRAFIESVKKFNKAMKEFANKLAPKKGKKK